MARRTKDELMAELFRLNDVFDAIIRVERKLDEERGETFELVRGEGEPDLERETKSGRTRMPLQYYAKFRARVLADIESGDETVSEAIGGVRAAVNDKLEDLSFDSLGEKARFLALYEEFTGRRFYDDAGRPGQAAKDILKRGAIADEDEWRILNGILSDVDQTLLTARQAEKAARLMDEFELSLGGKS